MISIVLGIIDAIVILAMDQQEFDRRYNDQDRPGQHDRYRRRTTRRDYQRQRGTTPARRTRQASRNVHVPERTRSNPYAQSGIKKYKDFELEEAIEDFIKGLEINPADVALHFNIACAYSLTEQSEKAIKHLDKAVELGFTDFDRIRTHDDLAYVRIQPEFEEFADANFRLVPKSATTPDEDIAEESEPPDDKLLTQLKRLAELRDKGLITEHEFVEEKEKLMR
jgi:tetratricopeptide (TPR) repeat protein